MNYAQQIKHPLWQKKRLEVLEANGYECQECRDDDTTLHVHHPFYKRGAMIWDYAKEELECLCEKCHKERHEIDEKIKKALALCSEKHQVLAFILKLNHDNKPRIPLINPTTRIPYKTKFQEPDDFELPEDLKGLTPAAFFAKMRAMLGDEGDRK